MNLVVSDSIRLAKLRSRADASRKKYGFRLIPAQSGKRRLCIHIAESVLRRLSVQAPDDST
ncbi:hypothetical protein DVJ83_06135 [Deinococcus wulumuqiensis]|uniref:Uncharacterized protein n=1 Tax=Deinococcus wulumuqiensis TaxID=980427 RepID=A0A345IGJ0_9DEIO|nr:hypothetical protein DVJ83_06135 [Deinococcus wulumuqiensis]